MSACIFSPTCAAVVKHYPSRCTARNKLIKSHLEALHLQRRLLQRRVHVKCKEGEKKDEIGHRKEEAAATAESIGFGADGSPDEWGAHAEPDKPASVFPPCRLCWKLSAMPPSKAQVVCRDSLHVAASSWNGDRSVRCTVRILAKQACTGAAASLTSYGHGSSLYREAIKQKT